MTVFVRNGTQVFKTALIVADDDEKWWKNFA